LSKRADSLRARTQRSLCPVHLQQSFNSKQTSMQQSISTTDLKCTKPDQNSGQSTHWSAIHWFHENKAIRCESLRFLTT